jgi:uncharacterized protein (DUF4415 family)/uncharacterized DUF497 family protein
MRFSWDPDKSSANYRDRGFDFGVAALIFDGPTLEREDSRQDYGERRIVAIGLVSGLVLTVCYTDRSILTAKSIVALYRPVGAIAVSAKPSKKPSRVAERPRQGRVDYDRVHRMSERDIMRTSPEELADLPADFWDDAELVVPVSKRAISLRVDEDVLEWFRGLGPGYQTRMNAVLRSYMKRASPLAKPSRSR